MSNILLIEPDYKNKYPPLGLMKISYFHKHILHDYVRFCKGKLPEVMSNMKWDRIYVTTLFTFEWSRTIDAINYAKTLVSSLENITVGGIAATLMPDQIFEETGIQPVCGLLNEPGKLGLPGDECIDQIIPDYEMLTDIKYVYPYHDAYFLSATKGCGMKCGFCAVQTLEPTYIPYMDIKDKMRAIDARFGPKKDLLLMDNNVLRSNEFDQIIDDIIEMGFGRDASYINPRTGKRVKRYVDFNQGLDGNFITEARATRLGEIALKPARIAFDHIEDLEMYDRSLRLCAKHGVTELSNYVLYNSEAFSGKGKQYHADTPSDLYDRMRITLDIKEEINQGLPKDKRVSAFSFPMRYIPLSAHERGYVGSQWNAKFLRAVQCMLIPTQGKGVGSRSFFEADFGKDSNEFVRFLCMPEKLIAARGKFVEGGRGHSKESKNDVAMRHKTWTKNQSKIAEWNRLISQLGGDLDEFINIIGDNEYLPEKLLGITCDLHKKLYLHYLTEPRLIALLGLIDHKSPTYKLILNYLTSEFPDMYQSILEVVVTSLTQQQYVIKNFIGFFGKKGLEDILSQLNECDYSVDKLLEKWNKTCVKSGMCYVDFELIRIYRRFVDVGVLTKDEHVRARKYISTLDMINVALLLKQKYDDFSKVILNELKAEQGNKILEAALESIFSNIQLKLSDFVEA